MALGLQWEIQELYLLQQMAVIGLGQLLILPTELRFLLTKQEIYMVLLVDLDTQKGQPSEYESIRVAANLVTPDGMLAPPDLVRQVGIGTRVRMVFSDVAPGLSLPQWTIDTVAAQPASPWRYPQE